MSTLYHLAFAWGVILLINVLPAFMPPTWSVLALFHISYHLPLLPLTIGGAAVSAGGRVVLARLSRRLGSRLPVKDRQNATTLASFVQAHPQWRDVLMFAYCLGPFPSNTLFIAAGIGRLPLRRVTVIFFISRSLGDTLWVWATAGVSRNLGDIFSDALTSPRSIAAQIASVALIVVVCRLPWATWLGNAISHTEQRGSQAVAASH
jgi:hypothetical protein